MNATAQPDDYQQIDAITDKYIFAGQKSISSIKQIICLTTDEESVANSQKLLEVITKIENALPTTDEEFKEAEVAQDLKTVNSSLHKVNAMFESIEALFKLDNDENKVEIDDAHMYDFLANMEKAKNKLQNISDYLTLVIEVQESKASISKKGEHIQELSIDAFIAFLEAA